MKRVFETAECEAVRNSIFWELRYEKHENQMKGCGVELRVSDLHTYIHTYIIVIYSGLMSLRTAKPLEAWGKKCLVGRELKLKQVCL